MQYHCVSLLQEGSEVTLIGYEGERLIPLLEESPSLESLLFRPLEWPSLKRKFWPGFAIIKASNLIFSLFIQLFRLKSRPQVILVQDPPSLPALPVVLIVGWFMGARVIIDWHNLGFTMLALALGIDSKKNNRGKLKSSILRSSPFDPMATP